MSRMRSIREFQPAVHHQHVGWVPRRRVARGPVAVRLWLPFTPIFLVLAPFAVITAPLLALNPRTRRLGLWRAPWALGALLLSLSGTLVRVDTPRAHILIRIL